MPDVANAAETLLAAVARARAFKDSTFVIKLGGSAMEDPAATAGTLDSIAALHALGLKMILVHGGGKPIDRAMAAAGIEVKKVLGRRYTDDASLEIVVRVLRNEINTRLVTDLNARGVPAKGYHSGPESMVSAKLLMLPGLDLQPVSLGHVGTPTYIDAIHLRVAWQDGYVPVLPSLGLDDDGKWLNINADTAAAAVAGAMNAAACLFLTDTPGVLKDRTDSKSLLPCLTVSQCKQLIADQVIDGGMIPKVEACFEALEMGAKKAVILDGRNPHSLLSLVLSDTLTGTEVLP
jgi:acetylglutamate kinase